MKRIALFLLYVALPSAALAGTDAGASPPQEVRSSIAEAAARWATHPLGIPTSLCTGAATPHSCCTGAGAGVCGGVSECTGAGDPAPCCSGAGTGSCLPVTCGGGECCLSPATDQECQDYAAEVDAGLQRQSWFIEQQTVSNAAFICNPYVPAGQQSGETFCRTFPSTQSVVDSFVATACSLIGSE